MKGRKHPLTTASTQGTCDDAETHFPPRVPLFPENGNANDAGKEQGEVDDGTPVDPLARLAAAVARLSPAERERLAAMLAGNQDQEGRG